ncbi:MAG: XRE family transcriptional regulator [Spirochaetaceae bacterium]|jgi:DNA-binding transcriptional regulator YiaG|nr:XRE family transcriptional regulator [Spirochaetaceae bacterium]
MRKRYKSEILQIVHEDAVGNFEIGAIDAERMREYDEACLEKEVLAAERSAVRNTARPAGAGVYASGR